MKWGPDKMRFFAVAAVLLGSITRAAGADTADASSPFVLLPRYIVHGEPILPDRESWRYVSIPGYEILSQATDARTSEVAASLLRFASVMERILPALHRTRAQNTWLLLCTDRREFETFVPAAVRAEFELAGVDRLFLPGPGREVVVLYLGRLSGAGNFEVDLTNDYLQRRLATARPPPPPWYAEGIARIFAAADVTNWRSHETIAVGKLDDRPRPNNVVETSDGSVSVNPVVTVDQAKAVSTGVARILRGDLLAAAATDPSATPDPAAANPDFNGLSFKRYFSESTRPVPPLSALFSGPPQTGYADWSQGCCLFVHYCLFGQGEKYFPEMERFLDSLGRGANPVAAFQAVFGKSCPEMDRILGYYLGSSNYQVKLFRLPPPGHGSGAPAMRDATDGEVAILKAGAYVNSGFFQLAWGELIAATRREKAAGSIEPRLRAAIAAGGGGQAELKQAR